MALTTPKFKTIKGLLSVFFLLTSFSACSPVSQAQTEFSNIPMSKSNTIVLVHGQGDPKHAVIWLHGLGATADDFPPIVPELGLSDERSIRFIFPQAPNRAITINNGMVMPGWYDIKGLSIEDKQDAVGMSESQSTVEALIEQQIAMGVPSSNIILAGFSQGGAVTYYSGVRSKHSLAGLLTMSTYLPFDEDTLNERSEANKNTPIFASHGTHDGVVPLALGENSVKHLKSLNYDVQWKTYPMEHQVVMEQIKDIGEWINRVFSQ